MTRRQLGSRWQAQQGLVSARLQAATGIRELWLELGRSTPVEQACLLIVGAPAWLRTRYPHASLTSAALLFALQSLIVHLDTSRTLSLEYPMSHVSITQPSCIPCARLSCWPCSKEFLTRSWRGSRWAQAGRDLNWLAQEWAVWHRCIINSPNSRGGSSSTRTYHAPLSMAPGQHMQCNIRRKAKG